MQYCESQYSFIVGDKPIYLEDEVSLYPPVPNPQSFRDFYAFEKHVQAARKLRGLEMNPDWYKIPIFIFKPASLYGHSQKYHIQMELMN